MKQLTLVILEDVYAQPIVAAGTAGPTVVQRAAAILRLGLPLPSAAPVPHRPFPPPSLLGRHPALLPSDTPGEWIRDARGRPNVAMTGEEMRLWL